MAKATAAGSRDRILYLLKTRGTLTAADLARHLDMTPMGARQHLQQLEEDGLVAWDEERGRVGRPRRLFRLTEAAAARFPEGYAELTVELLSSLERAFGPTGLDRLLAERAVELGDRYRERLPGASASIAERVAALARARTGDGYMAEWRRRRDGSFLLIENHCPICAAAEICQGLCRTELELFQSVLGADVTVARTEHLLDGARRCVYAITPVAAR